MQQHAGARMEARQQEAASRYGTIRALGTLCGALAGSILPLSIRTALGVMLYGMFIAIVVSGA